MPVVAHRLNGSTPTPGRAMTLGIDPLPPTRRSRAGRLVTDVALAPRARSNTLHARLHRHAMTLRIAHGRSSMRASRRGPSGCGWEAELRLALGAGGRRPAAGEA